MARALRLAARGLFTTHPNPRVGCVIVNGGRIVGEGWHERAGGPHAEVIALRGAGGHAAGATAYVTLEPCCHIGRTAPCVDALVKAGIAEVVAAMPDPNPAVSGRGVGKLRAAGVRVEVGLLESEARALNPGFVSLMVHKRPWVRLKLAASLDGRTAMRSGESKWITGAAARDDVQWLRARSSAVVTGVGTILTDDPSMNVRLSPKVLGLSGPVRQPVRAILDSRLSTPVHAATFSVPGQVLILTASPDRSRHIALEDAGAEVTCVAQDGHRLDLSAVLAELARRELAELHLECGSTLAGAFLSGGHVDEIVVYLGPHLMGNSAIGMAHFPGVERMTQRIALEWIDVRRVGDDLRVTARPRGHAE